VTELARVAICERTNLFREALAAMVTSHGHETVSCVGALDDALRAATRCDPDVVLLDASVVERGALALLRRGRKSGGTRRVFLLAGPGEYVVAAGLVEDGLADAVFHHGVAVASLTRAVDGRRASGSPGRRTPPSRPPSGPALTAREHDVISLLSAGSSTEAIAAALGVLPSTVHSHVRNILRKLDAHSRIEAVSIYLGVAPQRVGTGV
jgi:two-component system nitrate/nitrite response regulator NarL